MCTGSLKRDTPRDLNISRRGHGSIPGSEAWAGDIGVKCAPTQTARLNRDSHRIEMMLVKNVECVSTELEREALGEMNDLLQTDIKVAIAWLSEILDARSAAGIEVEAARRLERRCVEDWL